jgi:glyoxylate reductase
VAGAAALVADPSVPVDAPLLEAAGPSLRVVANFAVGYDNVDVPACRARGVVVTNTPDVLTNATAELTVALMLAAARRIGEGERLVRAGRWTGWEPGQLLGRELAGATVGIVGLGRIGTRVAELLRSFGVELLYGARSRRPEAEATLGARHAELDELLGRSDFVTLHLPLTPETRHLIDRRALARMKRGAILVNTARGALVDANALADAIAGGRLGGAGLDVYEHEPQVPPALRALERVVLAPHIGSATAVARDGMARLVAENVIAVLEGREPLTPVERG